MHVKITMSDGNADCGTLFARLLAGVDFVNIGHLLVHFGGVSKVDLHINPGGARVILIRPCGTLRLCTGLLRRG